MDRNGDNAGVNLALGASLSARRAWIEIIGGVNDAGRHRVALRKESVDRNNLGFGVPGHGKGSLSARRAWIEIGVLDFAPGEVFASLSARRAWIEISLKSFTEHLGTRRSPQGERG